MWMMTSLLFPWGFSSRLLALIQDSLSQLVLVCKGEMKLTNALRDLAQHISSSQVPGEWRRVYTSAPQLKLAEWIEDFSRRLKHLMLVAASFKSGAGSSVSDQQQGALQELKASLVRQSDGGNVTQRRVWLGGLLYPSAYLTATRQAVAQAKGWSLDDLAMEVTVGVNEPEDDQSFVMTGITIEGAAWDPDSKVGPRVFLCLSKCRRTYTSWVLFLFLQWRRKEIYSSNSTVFSPLVVPEAAPFKSLLVVAGRRVGEPRLRAGIRLSPVFDLLLFFSSLIQLEDSTEGGVGLVCVCTQGRAAVWCPTVSVYVLKVVSDSWSSRSSKGHCSGE